MKRITLREYQASELQGLTREEADSIQTAVRDLTMQIGKQPGSYLATPGSLVGGVSLTGLDVQILPKIGIERLLFLVSYAVDPESWKPVLQSFRDADSVVEAIAPAFAYLVSRATQRGLLHGYRSHEESLLSVRGRIRFEDQLRTRWGIAPPIEVRYDDHTADIDENRVLKAALYWLTRVRIRSAAVAAQLNHLLSRFEGVSLNSYQRGALPQIPLSRLNRHYEPAINLANLILANTSFDVGHGEASGSSFLLDMNDVFEAFLYRALLESLSVPASVFRRGSSGLTLDEAARVRLAPDLSWWHGGRCVFVGDAKYKRLDGVRFKHADLYQLLAYATAANVDHGLLVYAAGEADPAAHKVRFAGIELLVTSLDLSGGPAQILNEIDRIADGVRSKAQVSVCPVVQTPLESQ